MTFDQVFKGNALAKGKVLLGVYHVIGIIHKDYLVKDWKKQYKKPVTWKNFMQSKLKRSYFQNDFLQSIKNIVWGLGYTLMDLGKTIYFKKVSPLIIEVPNSNFIIALAPLNPEYMES